jgi:hypothetical protein
MKTFNIWKYDMKATGPTGPWLFMSACLATNEQEAMETAKCRYGSNGQYKIYGGLDA